MTPLDRLAWIEAVAGDRSLSVAALRVAMVLPKWLPLAYPSVATIAAAAGLGERGARGGLRALEGRGWIARQASPGRATNVYTATNPAPSCRDPEQPCRVEPGTVVPGPGTDVSPTRHGGAPEQGKNRKKRESAARTRSPRKAKKTPGVVSMDDTSLPLTYLERLRKGGARMKYQDQDLAPEWEALPASLGITEDQVIAYMNRTPPNRKFPSAIRQAATAAADGVVFDERKASADDIRALLSPQAVPVDAGEQNPDDHEVIIADIGTNEEHAHV